MTSKLKVNIIADGGDNAIMTSDGSGSLTINNASLKSTPAFEAHSNADQDISDNTYTKVSFQTEIFDSDGKFDNSSNFRFTPTVAGKYFVYGSARLRADTSQLQFGQLAVYKNGSIYAERMADFRSNNGLQMSVDVSTTIDLDTDDYVELFAKIFKGGGSLNRIEPTNKSTNFGAYRIIGI
tara:strand:- start:19137 stop:19679 length:543 start_codon:yes stop_codon:yes gene_type:complete